MTNTAKQRAASSCHHTDCKRTATQAQHRPDCSKQLHSEPYTPFPAFTRGRGCFPTLLILLVLTLLRGHPLWHALIYIDVLIAPPYCMLRTALEDGLQG